MGRRAARLAAAALVLGVLAAGCTDEQRKQLSPTCAIAQTAVDDAQRQAENAEQAVADLLAQARRSTEGRPVDGAVVTEAREGLLAAVKGVRADC